MIILAVDPGTSLSAYVAMDTKDYTILDKGKVDNDKMKEIVSEAYYDRLDIEGFQSFGMGVGQTVFDTAYLIGRLMQRAEDQGSNTKMVYRMDVKMHFCHSTRAKDVNVRQALIDRFGAPGTKKNPGKLYGVSNDIWSALAIATMGADETNS